MSGLGNWGHRRLRSVSPDWGDSDHHHTSGGALNRIEPEIGIRFEGERGELRQDRGKPLADIAHALPIPSRSNDGLQKLIRFANPRSEACRGGERNLRVRVHFERQFFFDMSSCKGETVCVLGTSLVSAAEPGLAFKSTGAPQLWALRARILRRRAPSRSITENLAMQKDNVCYLPP
jgi:hypothetical protein